MRTVRLSLTMAFLLTAILTMVNVSAFKQASSMNTGTLTVTTTGSAQLAFTATNGNFGSRTGTTANGVLWIDFGKGNSGTSRLMHAAETIGTVNFTGDDMEMRGVFTVTNNDTICQDLSVTVVGTAPAALNQVKGRGDNGAGAQVTFWTAPSTVGSKVKLGTSGVARQVLVDVRWQAPLTATAASSFQLDVKGSRSATCP